MRRMRPEEFTSRTSGRLIKSGSGDSAFWAFVPAPLPPALDWNLGELSRLSSASIAVGRLAGIGQMLPNPHLLVGAFKRQEAVQSSRIEGTLTTMSELLLFEVGPSGEVDADDAREVWNYTRALDHGLSRLKSLPLSKRLLCETHRVLMKDVRGQDRAPGEFRRTQNWIGRPGSTVATAKYVPPPVDELHPALDALEKFINSRSGIPALVRLAMVHYQFEAIHPYLDGNGRIGRLLITLMLCAENLLPQPLLYLSAFIERHKLEYYDRLIGVTLHGEWREWIEFFLRGVEEQSLDAAEASHRLLKLRDAYRAKFSGDRTAASLLRLIDELFATPAVSVPNAAKMLKVTPRAARRSVEKLVDAGVLVEATGQERNRVYLARDIVRALGGDESMPVRSKAR